MAIDLKEKTLKTEPVFNGKFLRIWRDDVELPDGRVSFREYIKHPGAALIVPVLANGNLLMEKQYRHAAGQVFLEFPAGKCDHGEKPEATAYRELEEEVGYRAARMELMTRIHPAIGYSNEFIDLFVAHNLTKTQTRRDHDELMDVVEISPKELEEKIWGGELTDVKTQIAAFWYLKSLKS